MTDLDEIIAKERHRRQRLQKSQRPMHWFLESGSDEPAREYWCETCVAYYGVPHDHLDTLGNFQSCRFLGRTLQGDRQCACLECVCADSIAGEGSLAARITRT